MDIEQQKSLLDDLDFNGEGMTDWEIDRLEEWLKQVERGQSLSEGQQKKLLEISKERLP